MTTESLVSRLEGASEGSRELDAAVWYACFEPDVQHFAIHVEQTEQGPREALTCELGSKWADDVGPYTTSIDAALSLAGRVLPGWVWEITTITTVIGVVRKVGALVVHPDHPAGQDIDSWGAAATPALALCAAILRANGTDQ